MARRYRGEGDFFAIQSPEISSTSSPHTSCIEQTDSNHILADFCVFPLCRPTYRANMHLHAHPYRGLTRNAALSRRTNNFSRFAHHRVVENHQNSAKGSMLVLGAMFLTNLLILWTLYRGFPALQEEEKPHIKIPWNLDDAKNLGIVLDRYKDEHFYHVYFGVSIMYIFLQTFAIPGSLFLSVLSGFLFKFWQAMFLVSTCSALGATLCFLISHLVGRRLVFRYFPQKATLWANTVRKHSDSLLNYVIFLRVTPFVPNWFINLTAPVIGVPLLPFAFGTWIGVMPPSFIALQAGQTLHTMSSDDAQVSWTAMSLLVVFGVVSLLPIYFKEKLKKKFD